MPIVERVKDFLLREPKPPAADEPADGADGRLGRMMARLQQPPSRMPIDAVILAMEEECAPPLYDSAVYNSLRSERAE